MRSHQPARIALAAAALMVLAGCGKAADTPAKAPDAAGANAMASPQAAPPVSGPPSPAAAQARKLSVENNFYIFDYAYPAAAAAIPALKTQLDADLDRQQHELAVESRAEADAAKAEGFPFNLHSRSFDWKVVADLPDWLSLSTLAGSYTGGAHPNYGYQTILWDKVANVARVPADLFQSPQALSAAIRDDFCRALNAQRAKKRGRPVNPASGDEFDACIDPAEQVVILGSSDGALFSRIGVLVAPYNAGPYAEGDYEVTLPVSRAVLAAVKAEYRRYFVVSR